MQEQIIPGVSHASPTPSLIPLKRFRRGLVINPRTKTETRGKAAEDHVWIRGILWCIGFLLSSQVRMEGLQ